MRTVILGGGLGGLSSAFYFLRKFPNSSPLLIESGNRIGGWIKSSNVENEITFESGPRTIRPFGEPGINTLELIEDLNLEKELVPILQTSPASRNRLIYAKGKLHYLPTSFLSILKKNELFSRPLYRLLINDFYAPAKKVTDEPIYDFIQRRFGTEIADYLISPLICGICAGNAKEISVNFLMKRLFQYEQQYGSIYKGIINNVLTTTKTTKAPRALPLRARKERWSVYSFKRGLETLPLSLHDYVTGNGGKLKMDTNCKQITFNEKSVTLTLANDEKLETDHVISSIPASFLAPLLTTQHPQLAEMLEKIKTVNVGVINFHYKNNVLPNAAFGFLAAPKEELPILGVIYDSCCFPRGDDTVLTVMMGGHWFEKYFGNNPSEDSLLKIAQEQLNKTLGIKDTPVQFKVNILQNCIPQYVVGHEENVNKIQTYIESKNLSISLCGASYFGVGVNDVILSAKNTIDKL